MKNKGFSLVEIIVVIAIMAVLMAVLSPAYLRYIEKSRDAKATQNAAEFRRVTENVLIDVLTGDLKDIDEDECRESYQAYSTNAAAPNKESASPIIQSIYDTMSKGSEEFEAIAVIKDYKVVQVAYRNLKDWKVYVWFLDSPEGSVLSGSEYADKAGEWLVFQDESGYSWIGKYVSSSAGSISWNGN